MKLLNAKRPFYAVAKVGTIQNRNEGRVVIVARFAGLAAACAERDRLNALNLLGSKYVAVRL